MTDQIVDLRNARTGKWRTSIQYTPVSYHQGFIKSCASGAPLDEAFGWAALHTKFSLPYWETQLDVNM